MHSPPGLSEGAMWRGRSGTAPFERRLERSVCGPVPTAS
jgi:hypothetical protein